MSWIFVITVSNGFDKITCYIHHHKNVITLIRVVIKHLDTDIGMKIDKMLT